MSPATHIRARMPRPPSRRPGLERLEERWVPSAVRDLPGFDASSLPPGDDNSSRAVPLGFTIDLHGQAFDRLFVNNNGNVTFGRAVGGFNPYSLSYLQRPVIAPFFADVDTRAAGRVHFGRDVVEGHKAFGVTWDDVGYYDRQAERTNRFQLVLIDRGDVAPGAFDIEFNYDRLNWDIGQSSSSSARAGFSTGRDVPEETFEVPGSGRAGALLDGGPNSLSAGAGRHTFDVRPNAAPVIDPIGTVLLPEGGVLSLQVPARDPDAGQALTYSLLAGPPGAAIDPATGLVRWAPAASSPLGDYGFHVRVTDSGRFPWSAEQRFTVTRVNVEPVVDLFEPNAPHHPAGEEFVLSGRFDDPGEGGWSAAVVIDDGDSRPLVLQPDGTFTVRHTFARQGVHTVTVTVTDGHGAADSETFTVYVLPPGSRGLIEVSLSQTAQPGETISGELTSPLSGATLALSFTHAADATGPATLFAAFYTSAPLETERRGLFFDLQGDGLVEGDTFTVTLRAGQVRAKGFQFGYFDTASGKWVDLLHSPRLAVVGLDEANGLLRVTFRVLDIFQGTVFTVSLPTAGGTTTGQVRPPTVSAGDGGGLGRPVTFASNSQLSLVLTASRDTQLSVSGTSQGSQAASAAANGVANSGAARATALSLTAGVGGNEEPARPDDDAGFWRWLQTDEGLLQLLLDGVDPTLLLPRKAPAEQVEEMPPADAKRPAPAPAAKPVVVDDEGGEVEVAPPGPEADEEPAEVEGYGEFTAALLAVAPGLLGDRRGRRRRKRF